MPVDPSVALVFIGRNQVAQAQAFVKAAEGLSAPCLVYIVDDGSREENLSRVRAAAKRLRPPAQVLGQGRQGGPAAAALVLGQAQSEVICFLEPECLPPPNLPQRLARRFQQDPELVALSGPALPQTSSGDWGRLTGAWEEFTAGEQGRIEAEPHWVAFRRSALLAAGGFDSALPGRRPPLLLMVRLLETRGGRARWDQELHVWLVQKTGLGALLAAEVARARGFFQSRLLLRRAGLESRLGPALLLAQSALCLGVLALLLGLTPLAPGLGLTLILLALLALYPLNRPFLSWLSEMEPQLVSKALLGCLLRPWAWLAGLARGALGRLTGF